MRVLLQRVRSASVRVGDELIGQIGPGLLALVGITAADSPAICERMAAKTIDLRIFNDASGRLNRSLRDLSAENRRHGVLVVSQFTLYADTRKGRRPSFASAASSDIAQPLVDLFAEYIRAAGIVTTLGEFGAEMLVSLENDGPVTIWLDSADLMRG